MEKYIRDPKTVDLKPGFYGFPVYFNMDNGTIRNTGGTDHQSFDPLGLPAFQFIEDEIEYGRGYHTNMDTYERLIMDDLKHNAIFTAALVYHAAMRDDKLPRKPYVKPDPNQRSRFGF